MGKFIKMRTFFDESGPRTLDKVSEVFREKIRSWENACLVGRSLESETE